jgi:hypothetical protein
MNLPVALAQRADTLRIRGIRACLVISMTAIVCRYETLML